MYISYQRSSRRMGSPISEASWNGVRPVPSISRPPSVVRSADSQQSRSYSPLPILRQHTRHWTPGSTAERRRQGSKAQSSGESHRRTRRQGTPRRSETSCSLLRVLSKPYWMGTSRSRSSRRSNTPSTYSIV